MTKVLELYFIGEEFYNKSKSMMSSLYVADTGQRYDYGFLKIALSEGKTVLIRPAFHF